MPTCSCSRSNHSSSSSWSSYRSNQMRVDVQRARVIAKGRKDKIALRYDHQNRHAARRRA